MCEALAVVGGLVGGCLTVLLLLQVMSLWIEEE